MKKTPDTLTAHAHSASHGPRLRWASLNIPQQLSFFPPFSLSIVVLAANIKTFILSPNMQVTVLY